MRSREQRVFDQLSLAMLADATKANIAQGGRVGVDTFRQLALLKTTRVDMPAVVTILPAAVAATVLDALTDCVARFGWQRDDAAAHPTLDESDWGRSLGDQMLRARFAYMRATRTQFYGAWEIDADRQILAAVCLPPGVAAVIRDDLDDAFGSGALRRGDNGGLFHAPR